jgi:hypothetical protein
MASAFIRSINMLAGIKTSVFERAIENAGVTFF